MTPAVDCWRYVTPCCGTTAWKYRATLGAYYCMTCEDHQDTLLDKKTDKRVQGIGQR